MNRYTSLASVLLAGTSLLPIAALAAPVGFALNSSPSNGTLLPLVPASNYAPDILKPASAIGPLSFANSGALNACAVSPDGSKAYISGGTSTVQVVNLAQNALAAPIPVPNPTSALALIQNGKFLLALDSQNNIQVINIATKSIASSYNGGFTPVTAIGSCDNGTTFAYGGDFVYNSQDNFDFNIASIDSNGFISTFLSSSTNARSFNNIYCAPHSNGNAFISLQAPSNFGPIIQSIHQNPSTYNIVNLPANTNPIAAAFNANGTLLYVLEIGTPTIVQAYAFNPTTGAFGNNLWTTSLSSTPYTPVIYGGDQIAVSADGAKVYVPGSGGLNILNASNGTLTYESAASLNYGSAICLLPTTTQSSTPPPATPPPCGPYRSSC